MTKSEIAQLGLVVRRSRETDEAREIACALFDLWCSTLDPIDPSPREWLIQHEWLNQHKRPPKET